MRLHGPDYATHQPPDYPFWKWLVPGMGFQYSPYALMSIYLLDSSMFHSPLVVRVLNVCRLSVEASFQDILLDRPADCGNILASHYQEAVRIPWELA